MSYRIVLEKEDFKFSGSHFTIFGSGTAERLHGHNYYVTLELKVAGVDPALGLAFDFNAIKPLIREITAELDEYVLLPANSPYLVVTAGADGEASVSAVFDGAQSAASAGAGGGGSTSRGKRYVFPASDTRVLPVTNVTAEELSRYIATELSLRMRKVKAVSGGTAASTVTDFTRVTHLAVGVQESRGQSVSFEMVYTP